MIILIFLVRENKEAFPIIFLLVQEIQDINLFPLVWNHKGIGVGAE